MAQTYVRDNRQKIIGIIEDIPGKILWKTSTQKILAIYHVANNYTTDARGKFMCYGNNLALVAAQVMARDQN